MKAWFISPVYLDVESFLKLRAEVRRTCIEATSMPAHEIHFIVIDDTAGADPQIRGLESLPDVSIITPPFNLGHQRALVYGLRKIYEKISTDDLIVTLDADGEDRPQDIPHLFGCLMAKKDDLRRIVLAKRTKRKESFRFKIMYFFFKILFRSLTGTSIQTGNFAAYRGWFAKEVLSHPHFDLCYSSALISLSLKIEYVPCERGERYAGRSRMGYFKLILHGMSMLLPFIDRIVARVFVFSASALAFAVICTLGAMFLNLATDTPVPAWIPVALAICWGIAFAAISGFVFHFMAYSLFKGMYLSHLDRNKAEAPSKQPDKRAA